MGSIIVSSLFVAILSCSSALAETQQAQFNQVLNVNGDMDLNSFQFPDGSKIETFSQTQQQLIVNQQTPAIPANQVVGTTGQPFVAVAAQSMTISTNGATDLVGGQIQMALNVQNLQATGVAPDNTYVAMLSPDRQVWMIQETLRSVNTTDLTVRMVKQNQIDGEYLIVGRQTVETNTLVVPFGNDGATSVAIEGTGIQENEFLDGFRMSTRATQPMIMNVDVVDGVDGSQLAALQGQEVVNDYRYSVTTNLGAVLPDLNQQVTVVQMPLNAVRIQKMMQTMGVPATGAVTIGVAQRGVLQNPGGATGNLNAVAKRGITRGEFRKEVARQVQNGQVQNGQIQNGQIQNGQQVQQVGQLGQGTPTVNNPVATALLLEPTFTPIQADAILDRTNMRIAIPVRQVDGEYILTMQIMGEARQAAPEAPAAAPAESQSAAAAVPAENATATSEAPAAATESAQPAAEAARLRRQAPATDKYGDALAPQGAVVMTMKMIDEMVNAVQWANQAPITEMMNNYVKAQTGRGLEPVGGNGTAVEALNIAV